MPIISVECNIDDIELAAAYSEKFRVTLETLHDTFVRLTGDHGNIHKVLDRLGFDEATKADLGL